MLTGVQGQRPGAQLELADSNQKTLAHGVGVGALLQLLHTGAIDALPETAAPGAAERATLGDRHVARIMDTMTQESDYMKIIRQGDFNAPTIFLKSPQPSRHPHAMFHGSTTPYPPSLDRPLLCYVPRINHLASTKP